MRVPFAAAVLSMALAGAARADEIVVNGGFEDPVGRSAWFSGLSSPSQGDPRPTAWQDLSGSEPILFQTVGSMGGGENGVETGQLGTSYDYLPVNGSVWGFFLQGYGGGYNGTKQDLGGIVAGTTYTVTADFARDHVVNPMQYDLFLMDGTANTALAGIDEVTGGVPAGGVWANKSFSYTATSADAGHELWIVLRARTASNSIRGGIDNVVVIPTTGGGGMSGYETWAGSNGASTDPAADSNNNGIPNGVEYFTGATALAPSTMPAMVTTGAGLTWTWPRDPSAAATYEFQVSDALSGWRAPASPGEIVDDSIPNQVKLTLTMPGASKKFCRLVVTPTP